MIQKKNEWCDKVELHKQFLNYSGVCNHYRSQILLPWRINTTNINFRWFVLLYICSQSTQFKFPRRGQKLFTLTQVELWSIWIWIVFGNRCYHRVCYRYKTIESELFKENIDFFVSDVVSLSPWTNDTVAYKLMYCNLGLD